MDEALESVVCCYAHSMSVSLQLLSKRDEGLDVSATSDDLDDDVQADVP